MAEYFVDKNQNSDGRHEVHHQACPHVPGLEQRLYLGAFSSTYWAVLDARKHFKDSAKCSHCAVEVVSQSND